MAIMKPEETSVPVDYLRASFENNPHGAGFAVAIDNKVEIYKGYFDFDLFYADYVLLTQEEMLPAAIHFRWATSGAKDAANTHPFPVAGMGMIHNGVIIEYSGISKDESDTNLFAQDADVVLRGRPELVFDPAFHRMVEAAITTDKIVFLLPDGDFSIIGEGRGHWKNGVWYSNRGYIQKKSTVTVHQTPVQNPVAVGDMMTASPDPSNEGSEERSDSPHITQAFDFVQRLLSIRGTPMPDNLPPLCNICDGELHQEWEIVEEVCRQCDGSVYMGRHERAFFTGAVT